MGGREDQEAACHRGSGPAGPGALQAGCRLWPLGGQHDGFLVTSPQGLISPSGSLSRHPPSPGPAHPPLLGTAPVREHCPAGPAPRPSDTLGDKEQCSGSRLPGAGPAARTTVPALSELSGGGHPQTPPHGVFFPRREMTTALPHDKDFAA